MGLQRLRRFAGGETARDLQLRLAARGEIAVAHGVTVDGRVVERRKIDMRGGVFRDDAAACFVERHGFGFAYWLHAFDDQLLHVRKRHQRAGECKAIVGELRHQAGSIAASIGTACFKSRSQMTSISFRSTTGTFACGSATSAAIATMRGSSGCSSGLPLSLR